MAADPRKVERVARAIFEANAGKWRQETWESAGGDLEYSSTREAYFREAEAAIAAMRPRTDQPWAQRLLVSAIVLGAALWATGLIAAFPSAGGRESRDAASGFAERIGALSQPLYGPESAGYIAGTLDVSVATASGTIAQVHPNAYCVCVGTAPVEKSGPNASEPPSKRRED